MFITVIRINALIGKYAVSPLHPKKVPFSSTFLSGKIDQQVCTTFLSEDCAYLVVIFPGVTLFK